MANEKPLNQKELARIHDAILPDDLAQIEAAAIMSFVNNIVVNVAKGRLEGHETTLYHFYNAALMHCAHFHAIEHPSLCDKFGEEIMNLCRYGNKEANH